MKIKVLHDFFDKDSDLELRSAGTVLNVTEERAKYLARMKLVEIVPEKSNQKKAETAAD